MERGRVIFSQRVLLKQHMHTMALPQARSALGQQSILDCPQSISSTLDLMCLMLCCSRNISHWQKIPEIPPSLYSLEVLEKNAKSYETKLMLRIFLAFMVKNAQTNDASPHHCQPPLFFMIPDYHGQWPVPTSSQVSFAQHAYVFLQWAWLSQSTA
ncbi:hypothetical protein B0O99DRAFT_291192 [Bisporella sp. PMI_857]|nr:hypothetical protein B0O99DRAFT_291192 [Bisporella sp. PMI_857]